MKTTPPTTASLALLLLVGAASPGTVRAVGVNLPVITARTNSIAAGVTLRKSVFDPDAPGARNPFYPDAVRLSDKVGVDAGEPTVTAFSQLKLLGLVSGRSAIINNRKFVVGDEASVRLPGGRKATVKVIAVHEDSVTLTVNGQKELKTLFARGASR